MDIVRQSLAITFVFALLWGALWFLRKKGSVGFPKRHNGGRLLESVARLSLSGQHSVHIVRAGGRELILGVHPSGVTLLAERASGEKHLPPEVAQS